MTQPTDSLATAFDADPGDGDPDGATPDGTTDDAPDQLGDAGKKALDAMKAKWQTERDAAKPWKALARELGVKNVDEVKALIAAGKTATDDAPDPDKMRREAEAQATVKANSRIVRAEVKALAAGKFADPADAALYLNLDDFEVDDNGDVDTDAIGEALDDLLTRKPHLAASRGRFPGGGDGGHRGGAAVTPASPLHRLEMAFDADIKQRAGRRNG